MARKVIHAKFHASVFVPGIGHFGDVLPSQSKSCEKLEMMVAPEGLFIDMIHKGLEAEVLIPLSNVVSAKLAPKEKK